VYSAGLVPIPAMPPDSPRPPRAASELPLTRMQCPHCGSEMVHLEHVIHGPQVELRNVCGRCGAEWPPVDVTAA
jgi:ribosomal protein S27AE